MHDVLTLKDLGSEHIGKKFYMSRDSRRLRAANTVVFLGYAEPHGLPTWKFMWMGMIQELFGQWYLLSCEAQCQDTQEEPSPQSVGSLFERALGDNL